MGVRAFFRFTFNKTFSVIFEINLLRPKPSEVVTLVSPCIIVPLLLEARWGTLLGALLCTEVVSILGILGAILCPLPALLLVVVGITLGIPVGVILLLLLTPAASSSSTTASHPRCVGLAAVICWAAGDRWHDGFVRAQRAGLIAVGCGCREVVARLRPHARRARMIVLDVEAVGPAVVAVFEDAEGILGVG